jgi:hypothetical protein
LDWSLRQQLKVPPEDRYRAMKEAWYFHPTSWYMRRKDGGGYDGIGCNGKACVPECKFYPQTGRIEDSEVIQKHRELEEHYKKNNAIVEPTTTTTTRRY